ncbi:MAG TPA: hypothetical protein VEA92_03110 [Candidatus Paceibacterota bacterium]|nr:hypothetical protein [Candidatus Paceibacterota bacterium]
MQTVIPQLEAANVDQADRLVQALARHGFIASVIKPDFCDDASDPRPCIPAFKMKGGKEEQERLTNLVIAFYEDHPVPADDNKSDTQLMVEALDDDEGLDRELEFEYELGFNDTESIVGLPYELFEHVAGLGGSIEDRRQRKMGRFADFLLQHPVQPRAE